MKVDILKTEKENLIDLFNLIEGIDLDINQVTLSNLTVLNDTRIDRQEPNFMPITLNTSIKVSTENEDIIVEYRRLHIEDCWYIANNTDTLEIENDITLENALSKIEEYLKIIKEKLVINLEDNTLTISANEDSLIYIGSVNINIVKKETNNDVDTIRTTGFVLP